MNRLLIIVGVACVLLAAAWSTPTALVGVGLLLVQLAHARSVNKRLWR